MQASQICRMALASARGQAVRAALPVVSHAAKVCGSRSFMGKYIQASSRNATRSTPSARSMAKVYASAEGPVCIVTGASRGIGR